MSEQISLAADVRRKYIDKLAERYNGIAGFVGAMIGVIVAVQLNLHGWVRLAPIVGGALLGAAIVDWSQRQWLTTSSDALLQVAYEELLAKEHHNQLLSRIAGLAVVGIIIAVFALSEKARSAAKQIFQASRSAAACTTLSASATPDTYFLAQQPNYGVTVQATIKNTGDSGDVFVAATLSTSEGEFKRQQQLHLDAGQTQRLEYQFSEPTLNATNVRYAVSCTP